MPNIRQNAGPTFGSSGVDALNVAFSIYTDIDSNFFEVEYPEYEHPDWHKNEHIRSGSEGATSYGYIVRDTRGSAKFIGNGPHNDLPTVGQSIEKVEVPIGYTGVSAIITDEDARQYKFGGISADTLAADLGTVMRRALENLFEVTFFFGSQFPRMYGILNNPNVKTTSEADFMTMPIMDLMTTINKMMTDMWQETNGLFLPTHLYMPYDVYGRIVGAEPIAIGTTAAAVSPMAYLRENNIATHKRQGTPLIILPSRYLANAGLNDSRRIVAFDMTNTKNMVVPFPLPYTINQPVPLVISAIIPAVAKFGSPHLR